MLFLVTESSSTTHFKFISNALNGTFKGKMKVVFEWLCSMLILLSDGYHLVLPEKSQEEEDFSVYAEL